METSVQLQIDSTLLARAQQYATESQTDLSGLVEDLLRRLSWGRAPSQSHQAASEQRSYEELMQLAGSLPLADDEAMKAEYAAYLEQKYR